MDKLKANLVNAEDALNRAEANWDRAALGYWVGMHLEYGPLSLLEAAKAVEAAEKDVMDARTALFYNAEAT